MVGNEMARNVLMGIDKIRRLAWIWIFLLILISGEKSGWAKGDSSQELIERKNNVYTLPFTVEPELQGVYDDLIQVYSYSKDQLSVINQAIKVVSTFDRFLIIEGLLVYHTDGQYYGVDVYLYQNEEYFLVIITPRHLRETSRNIDISIRKTDRKVVKILPGS